MSLILLARTRNRKEVVIIDLRQRLVPSQLDKYLPEIKITKGPIKSYPQSKDTGFCVHWHSANTDISFDNFNKKYNLDYQNNTMAISIDSVHNIESINVMVYHMIFHSLLDIIKNYGQTAWKDAFDNFIEQYKLVFGNPQAELAARKAFGHWLGGGYGEIRWLGHETFICMSAYTERYFGIIRKRYPQLTLLIQAYLDFIHLLEFQKDEIPSILAKYSQSEQAHSDANSDLQNENDRRVNSPNIIESILSMEDEIEKYYNLLTAGTAFYLLSNKSLLVFRDINNENTFEITAHLIREYKPDGFWEPEYKRMTLEKKYRDTLYLLTDDEVETLVRTAADWPEIKKKMVIEKNSHKIQEMVDTYKKLRHARAQVMNIVNELDGWTPIDVFEDGKVMASRYLEGVHATSFFEPKGPWEKIAKMMQLGKNLDKLSEWAPDAVIEEFNRQIQHLDEI